MNETGRVMKRKNPYMIVDVTPFRDSRLSWKAKGLMSYFLDKPDDWKFILEHIYTQAPDGKASVRSGLKELQKYGYLVRVAYRVGKVVSHYDWLVYEEPVAYPSEKPIHVNLKEWEEHLANGGTIDITLFAENRKTDKPLVSSLVAENQKAENQKAENQKAENRTLLNTKSTKYLKQQRQQPNSVVIVDLIKTKLKTDISQKQAEELISIAVNEKKDITQAIEETAHYFETTKKEIHSVYGVIHHAIMHGWDVPAAKSSYAPSSPANREIGDDYFEKIFGEAK